MNKQQLTEIVRELVKETIRKIDGKYVVYPEKGGKRLGTHPTKSAAEKQLTAIHLNKEAVIKGRVFCNSCNWNWKISEGGKDVYLCHKCGHDNTPPALENYADGKVKGKSKPGRVKKSGASCKGSVTDLRAKAKKYGGEKGKMYHWCANMKSGRKK